MGEQKIIFESLEEAEKFIKENKIKFFHYRTSKALDKEIELIIEPTFVCEICHEETPTKCEGSEPNTCAMCMPEDERQIGA